MRNNNLVSALMVFLFSLAGYMAHWITVWINSNTSVSVAIIAFLYVTPLLLQTLDDFSIINESNMEQYIIDKASIVIGVIYLIAIFALFVLQTKGILVSIVWLDFTIKLILAIAPIIFVVRKFYTVRQIWVQKNNLAKAYFRKPVATYSK